MVPQLHLSYCDCDSPETETETDSREDRGILLIPIRRLSTTTPAEQPTSKYSTVAKRSLSPLKTNFRTDEAWLVCPAAETLYERLS